MSENIHFLKCNNPIPNIFTDPKSPVCLLLESVNNGRFQSILCALLQLEKSESSSDTLSLFVGLLWYAHHAMSFSL